MHIGLEHYLVVSALLFTLGLFGVIARRNLLVIYMSLELMLNAANLALVAFSRFVTPQQLSGQAITIFSIVVAAAEVTVGLAIIIALFRQHKNINVDEINLLKW